MFSMHFNTIPLWKGILFMLCSTLSFSYGRTVPAREELCNRFPSMQVCQSSSAQSAPSPAVAAPEAAPLSAPASSSGAQDPTASSGGSLDRGTYCQQYQSHFSYYCAPTAAQTNSQQANMFCDSYKSNCDSPEAPAASSMSPERIDAMCKKYGGLAKTNCNGNEQNNKIIKEYCDLYRQYCLGQGPPPGAKSSVASSNPPDEQASYCSKYKGGFYEHCSKASSEPKTVQFCRAFNDYCNMGIGGGPQQVAASDIVDGQRTKKYRGAVNANTSAVVRAQCEQYKVLANVYCPGYEVAEMRQNCNMYRVYCQGKPPFPGIDGNLGFTQGVWGVAGIPFYPFNPQGAIAGGTRSNVGFGDWGGSYTQRTGVSDFFDSQKKVNANWHKGNFMVNDGWNVPLTGISGFAQNGVQLNGLPNPSDWPALQSGGMPIPAFGGGQMGPMPFLGSNMNGLPFIG